MGKMYTKDAWKKLTSPKAKARYKAAGKALGKAGVAASRYTQRTGRALDQAIGTIDPSPNSQLTGVALPKGYKIKKLPKIVRGPKGDYIVYETKLVRTNSSNKRKKPRKKSKGRKR